MNAPHIEADGTPAAAVSLPTAQQAFAIAGGVVIYVGVNPEAARLVAEMTGDPIAWPFSTVGLKAGDDDEAAAVFVLHGHQRDEAGSRLVVSAVVGLPLTREMLGCLAVSTFYSFGADTILMRVRRADHRTRRALERIGFTVAGPDLRPDRTPGLLYALDARTVLPRWRRYCRHYLPTVS